MTRSPVLRLGWLRLASLLFALAADAASAQPPGPPAPPPANEPQSYILEEVFTGYRFEVDGSGTRVHRVTVLVNDQAAVRHWGSLAFSYMAATETVALRALVVEKPDGRRVEAKDAPLEDVRMTGQVDEPILSDWRAKKVTVPALQPGDRLRYGVEVRRSTSLIPNHFWLDHDFALEAVVLKETLEVDTPAARPVKISVRLGTEDPAVRPAAGRSVRRWTHKQSTPRTPPTAPKELEALAEETKLGPHVRVSSFESWNQLTGWFDGVLANRIESDEAVRSKAIELTRDIASPEVKLRALFDFVSTKIRYVSLAFGMGRLEPRAAAQVLATEYGDCKDKHVLFASLARAIGQDIRPVLISSGLTLDERVPSPSQFDHVVSVRTDGDPSKWLWMDTTSGLLPPGALLAPLRDKKAVLVRADVSGSSEPQTIVTSPASLPTRTSLVVDVRGRLESDGAARTTVVKQIVGDIEYLLRLALRGATQPALKEVAQRLTSDDGIRDATIVVAEFRDEGPGAGVELRYEATNKYTLPRGKPWQMWVPTPNFELEEAPETGDLELGELAEVAVAARYEMPAGAGARPPVAVTLDRPFARYTSTYRVDGNVLLIERRLQTRLRKIAGTDLDDYRAFRRAVDADYRQSFSVDALAATDPAAATADELNAAGYAAIESHEYAKAIELLKRAVEADPKHRQAWNNLGRAYMGLPGFDAAIDAFQKQIALNPYDEYAYGNLGHIRQQQGKLDEAITQFKKQIEVSPLHAYAHRELGRVYLRREQYDEAESWLEKAVVLSPEDAALWIDVGRARLWRGKEDEAIAAFNRGIELAANPTTWNNVAWALAEKGARLELAEKHVRAAIERVSAGLATVRADELKAPHVRAVDSLAAYWDTLGWVYFRRGDTEQARPWLEGAWMLSESGEVAEHLGELYERQGARERAVQLYAQAVAASNRAKSREALERLVGTDRAEEVVAIGRKRTTDQKVVRLPMRIAETGTADLYLLLERGRIKAVRPIRGHETLMANSARLIGVELPPAPPDEKPLQLIRQAVVECASDGCTISMLPSSLARTDGLPAK